VPACALRLPPGDRLAGHPRRALLGAPAIPPTRLCLIGQTNPARRVCAREGARRAALIRRNALGCRPLAVFPKSIALSATVASGTWPSRRAGPSPRLRLRAAPTLRLAP